MSEVLQPSGYTRISFGTLDDVEGAVRHLSNDPVIRKKLPKAQLLREKTGYALRFQNAAVNCVTDLLKQSKVPFTIAPERVLDNTV